MLPEMLPYELIGQTVVLASLTALVVVLSIIVGFLLAAAWYRGWTWMINRAWGEEYDFENLPPKWRRKISIICYCIRDLRIASYRERWKKAEESYNDD